jgi:Domain of unknown function (DUF1707)
MAALPSLPTEQSPEPSTESSVSAVGIRASDPERQRVVDCLHHALAEGRLDLDETDTRVAAAYAARYRADLGPLLADLPPQNATDGVGASAPSWATMWTAMVWRARTTLLKAPADTPPTARQCRGAVVLALLALGWIALCAVLGAVVVAA